MLIQEHENPTKAYQRKKIAEATATFLANGGVIRRIPRGISTYKEKKLKNGIRE